MQLHFFDDETDATLFSANATQKIYETCESP